MSDFPVPFNGDWSREHVGAISVTPDWPLDQQALRLITSFRKKVLWLGGLLAPAVARSVACCYTTPTPSLLLSLLRRQTQATTFFFFSAKVWPRPSSLLVQPRRLSTRKRCKTRAGPTRGDPSPPATARPR